MMNRKFLIFILVITLIYLLNNARAQSTTPDIAVKATVNKQEVAQDEELNLKVEISGKINETPTIKLPDLVDFYILSSAQSQNYSFSKDKKSQLNITLQYILMPKKQGKLSIGPIVVKHKFKAYKSNPITIEVGPPKKPLPKRPEEKEEPVTTEEGIIL